MRLIVTAWNPAQRYGLPTKGTIAEGYDADFCLVDPSASWTVHADDSESTQEYTRSKASSCRPG